MDIGYFPTNDILARFDDVDTRLNELAVDIGTCLKKPGRYQMYEDFHGDIFTQRTLGNFMEDPSRVQMITSKIFRPLWVIEDGVPINEDQKLQLPVGNIQNQRVHTLEMEIGINWILYWQFLTIPTTGQFHFDFCYQDATNHFRLNNDVTGGNIILGSVQGGAWFGIGAPEPWVADDVEHFYEMRYAAPDTWDLDLDAAPIINGVEAWTCFKNRIRIFNSTDAALYITLLTVV